MKSPEQYTVRGRVREIGDSCVPNPGTAIVRDIITTAVGSLLTYAGVRASIDMSQIIDEETRILLGGASMVLTGIAAASTYLYGPNLLVHDVRRLCASDQPPAPQIDQQSATQ